MSPRRSSGTWSDAFWLRGMLGLKNWFRSRCVWRCWRNVGENTVVSVLRLACRCALRWTCPPRIRQFVRLGFHGEIKDGGGLQREISSEHSSASRARGSSIAEHAHRRTRAPCAVGTNGRTLPLPPPCGITRLIMRHSLPFHPRPTYKVLSTGQAKSQRYASEDVRASRQARNLRGEVADTLI